MVRLLSDACDHSANASWAAATPASTSALLPSTTSACCAPVAGFHTGAVRSEVPAVDFPAIQCSIVLTGSPSHRGFRPAIEAFRAVAKTHQAGYGASAWCRRGSTSAS